jgi:hypothetical protein
MLVLSRKDLTLDAGFLALVPAANWLLLPRVLA